MEPGRLYLCGTPIGNLEDITLRALRVLREADYIGAEDTRWSRKLLQHYNIKKQPFSCYTHNELQRADWIKTRLEKGARVALISSAGMPTISDPGSILVEEGMRAGYEIEIIPGPSAVTAALALSGWGGQQFYFAGFLEKQGKKRKEELQFITSLNCPTVLFESPYRLLQTLQDLQEITGEKRQVFLARELTKIHQETIGESIENVISHLKRQDKVRGEITLVLEGAPEAEKKKETAEGTVQVQQLVQGLQDRGLSNRQVVEILQESLNWPRNRIYDFVHQKNKES